VLGGTSDGYLFELRVFGKDKQVLRPRGRVLAQGNVQGLVIREQEDNAATFVGVAGEVDGMPRGFTFRHGGSQSAVIPHGIPRVDGLTSMVGFGALLVDARGTVY